MVAVREEFSSEVSPAALEGMREIARREGRPFEDVLEDALNDYIEGRAQRKVRPEVMAHFRDSVEKNRRLYELLAQ